MRVGIVVGLMLLGCKGELNPTFCAMHREDPDCELVVEEIEPPAHECDDDAQCAGNPNGGACDMARHACAQCVPGGNVSACMALNQQCGTDQLCHGCVRDENCASGVCLATQTCADEAAVLYATPEGDGDTCTAQEPCDFEGAVDALSSARHIIKLNHGTSGAYTGEPISIDAAFGVQILGKGVTFQATDNEDGDPAISATGANLEILGLTVLDATSASIRCTSGVLTLQQVQLTRSDGYGVQATGCTSNIKRSDISGHRLGAIQLTGGMHEIRNNMIHDNGNSQLSDGVVSITGATGRARFNTIVRTTSRSGGGRVGGVKCTTAATFLVTGNLIVDWGDAKESVLGCSDQENHKQEQFELAGFVSTIDFHLTTASPEAILDLNSATLDADCTLDTDGTVKIDDFDGQVRPFNGFCDKGADEYQP